jgi:hypothetical protein
MKKRKPPGLDWAGQKPPGTGATEDDGDMRLVQQKPLQSAIPGSPGPELTPKLTMTAPGRAPKARPRGRLNRAALALLGKGLAECFDEIRNQEVPERFKMLLQQF